MASLFNLLNSIFAICPGIIYPAVTAPACKIMVHMKSGENKDAKAKIHVMYAPIIDGLKLSTAP